MEAATTSAPLPASPSPAIARPPGLVRGFLREMGELTIFAGFALRALPATVRYASEALRQAQMMFQGTLMLLLVMELFLGITTTNFAFFFLRSIGASDFMGIIPGYAGPRQLAPTMFGYVFTAKVCCGMAAELGAMKIQEEVDALEATGIDPHRYLVGTRLLGVLIFAPVGAAVALIGILAGVYFESVFVLNGIAGNVLLDVNWAVQTVKDQAVALLAMTTMAVFTAIVACFYGLRTTGGPDAVGNSVARSLVINLVLLHLIGVFFAVLVYGTGLNLPIGG